MTSFLLYLAISLLTLVLISSSTTVFAQSEHLERGLQPSGVVKLSSRWSAVWSSSSSKTSGFRFLPSALRFGPRLHLAGDRGLAATPITGWASRSAGHGSSGLKESSAVRTSPATAQKGHYKILKKLNTTKTHLT